MNIANINPFFLPSRLLTDRRNLPQCQAIYFVIDGDSILYIGRTANLAERWIAHHRFNQLEANPRIAWLECSNEELLPELERALIKHFSPLLNGTDVLWETKKAKITFTCSHELREELDAIAEQEDRTLSKLVERLVTKALLDYKKPLSLEQNESASPNPPLKNTPRPRTIKGVKNRWVQLWYHYFFQPSIYCSARLSAFATVDGYTHGSHIFGRSLL